MSPTWTLPRLPAASAIPRARHRGRAGTTVREATHASAPPDGEMRAVGRVAALYWLAVVVLDMVNDGPVASLSSPRTLAQVLFDSGVWWSGWLLATPLLLLLFRALDPRRIGWRRWVAAHFALGAGFAVAHIFMAVWTFRALQGSGVDTHALAVSFLAQFLLGEILTYWGLTGFVHLTSETRRAHALDVEAGALRMRVQHLEARHRLARATALHREIDGHFVLNALHGVGSLVRLGSGPRALTALERIGALVRSSSAAAAEPEVPLARELALLQLYLGLEEARRGEEVAVRWQVDDEVRTAAVPPLLLQPLVENALRHGREPGAGRIAIRGRRAGGRLRLEVQDHGGPPRGPVREGTGLSTTRARLRLLHGADADLALFGTGDGMTAEVTLPYRSGWSG